MKKKIVKVNIAVLDFYDNSVHIFRNVKFDEGYDTIDIENYLSDVEGFHVEDIHFLASESPIKLTTHKGGDYSGLDDEE